MGVDAIGIGLPDLDQHILHRRAQPIINNAFDPYPFARHCRACYIAAQFGVIQLEPRRTGGKPDVDIRPRRL